MYQVVFMYYMTIIITQNLEVSNIFCTFVPKVRYNYATFITCFITFYSITVS